MDLWHHGPKWQCQQLDRVENSGKLYFSQRRMHPDQRDALCIQDDPFLDLGEHMAANGFI